MRLQIHIAILIALCSLGLLFYAEVSTGETKVVADFEDGSYSQGDSHSPERIALSPNGVASASFRKNETATIYFERRRETLRPRIEDFNKEKISMEIKCDWNDSNAGLVLGKIFIKDKDGLWFQSRETYSITPGAWQKIDLNLMADAHDIDSEGSLVAWSSLNLAIMHTVGFKILNAENRELTIACRNITLAGARKIPELYFNNLDYPKHGEQNGIIEGSFNLSREYFNPFDAEEIAVDVQIVSPDLRETTFPAYFTADYARRLQLNREIRTPIGKPHWAFRFTPTMAGVYKFRITARDSYLKQGNEASTPYLELDIGPSKLPGFVRVSKKDPRYFEFSSGELFFPIGFNIHSVKDTRSEKNLKLGYRPDRGTYSYDEYFDAAAKSGVNAVEIWMAAWSFALEWTSSWTDYYGLGRYNLFNAWRLDHILSDAKEKGIYVHLVLDNHGKLANEFDSEWSNSPYNKHLPFAIANGAMLDQPKDFFTENPAENYYRNRNRYIAARWGAYTNIFGIELWSEVDLITDHRRVYDNGISQKWHKMAAEHLIGLDQGRHLLTTHTCCDYNNAYRHRDFYDMEQISYIASDAYSPDIYGKIFVDHMLRHTERLKEFNKPIIITEFGGTQSGGSWGKIEADLHAGIWSSFFGQHAGTPMLWWHDFIHDKGKYFHFRGFSMFMKGIDPRARNFTYSEVPVTSGGDTPNYEYRALTTGNKSEYYAWIFRVSSMESYPAELTLGVVRDHAIALRGLSGRTRYKVSFHDTLTGATIRTEILQTSEVGELGIVLAPFGNDIAIKVLRDAQGERSLEEKEG